jgi:hypothetical protein
MAIFFRCGCGQDLRADEQRAGGSMECPACGCRTPVPSLVQANHGVGQNAFPPLELPPRLGPPAAPAGKCPALPDPLPSSRPGASSWLDTVELPTFRVAQDIGPDPEEDLRRRVFREARWLFTQASKELDARHGRGSPAPESAWFQCLLFPLRAWPILLGLGLAWATLAVALVAVLPVEWEWSALGPRLPLLMVGFFLLSYTCAFYGCVVASSAAGETGVIRWPGGDLLQALRSGIACLVCFLVGPVVPAVVALLFWIHAGDLTWVDEAILWELGAVAVGCWVLALLAVGEKGRLRDANPLAVARLVGRLGWRGGLAVALIVAGVVVQFRLMLGSLEDVHESPGGWLALVAWGVAGSAWVVFLLRWFGVSRYHRYGRPERAEKRPRPEKQKRLPSPRPKRPIPLPPDQVWLG